MELLFLFIPFAIAVFVGKRFLYDPFASGQRQIDKLKYPTLARTQRVLRARNIKARETEINTLKQIRSAETHKALAAIEKKSKENVDEARAKHYTSLADWEKQYNALTAPEEKHKADAKKKAEDDAWEERREREKKIWAESKKKHFIAQEKIRRAEPPKDIVTPNDLKIFQEAFDATMSKMVAPNETIWSVPMGNEDSSYGDRQVSVHALYVRRQPTKNSMILNNLVRYEKFVVDGWTVGEEVYNNPLWFHIKPGTTKGLAGWVWGGGLNNQSTSGLKRINSMDVPKKIGPMGASIQFQNKDLEAAQVMQVFEQLLRPRS